MKYTAHLLIAFALFVAACGQKSDHTHHDHDKASGDNPNEVLKGQVNDIHMEAMGKLDELIRLKTQLRERAKSKTLTEERKKELSGLTLALDSANDAMMDWMHGQVRNTPDSTDVEKTREYYETQLESIRKIRDFTNEVIEKAKEEAGKKE
jgi:hypothetical protein